MDIEVVKVSCTICGKEITCPKHMVEKVEKHLCFGCFNSKESIDKLGGEEFFEKNIISGKFHVDIPIQELEEKLPEVLAEKMTDEIFPEIWKKLKEEVESLNKRDLAEEMFYQGVVQAVVNFMQNEKINEKMEN